MHLLETKLHSWIYEALDAAHELGRRNTVNNFQIFLEQRCKLLSRITPGIIGCAEVNEIKA